MLFVTLSHIKGQTWDGRRWPRKGSLACNYGWAVRATMPSQKVTMRQGRANLQQAEV